MINIISSITAIICTTLAFWETLRPYRGARYNHERDPLIYGVDPAIDGAPPTETEEYVAWTKKLRTLRIIGFVIIITAGIIKLLGELLTS